MKLISSLYFDIKKSWCISLLSQKPIYATMLVKMVAQDTQTGDKVVNLNDIPHSRCPSYEIDFISILQYWKVLICISLLSQKPIYATMLVKGVAQDTKTTDKFGNIDALPHLKRLPLMILISSLNFNVGKSICISLLFQIPLYSASTPATLPQLSIIHWWRGLTLIY